MCPGVDSASKIEYQDNPGGKGGRCVRLATYHLHEPIVKKSGALTSCNPVGLFRPVMGQLYLLSYAIEQILAYPAPAFSIVIPHFRPTKFQDNGTEP